MQDTHSRSPSPVPSAGMESSSFKETNMQIEILSFQQPSSGITLSQYFKILLNYYKCIIIERESTNKKSVMSGGEVKGWTPDVAALLWRRMLGALGDVNKLENPNLHEQLFRFLLDLYEIMTKVSKPVHHKMCYS